MSVMPVALHGARTAALTVLLVLAAILGTALAPGATAAFAVEPRPAAASSEPGEGQPDAAATELRLSGRNHRCPGGTPAARPRPNVGGPCPRHHGGPAPARRAARCVVLRC